MYGLKAAQTYVRVPTGPHIYICAAHFYLISVFGIKSMSIFLARVISVCRADDAASWPKPIFPSIYNNIYNKHV